MSRDHVLPQLSDPMVRRMAERDHRPAEMWAIDGHLISLHCDACGQSWPRATRRALDAIEGQHGST